MNDEEHFEEIGRLITLIKPMAIRRLGSDKGWLVQTEDNEYRHKSLYKALVYLLSAPTPELIKSLDGNERQGQIQVR